MPQPNVCDLLKGQRFEGFLLVRSSDQRTGGNGAKYLDCLLYTSPSPRDRQKSRMPSSA